MSATQVLPGTGRGTMHSMVEGDCLSRHLCRALSHASSTDFAGPPPRAGEEL